jgi:hypothetical protein
MPRQPLPGRKSQWLDVAGGVVLTAFGVAFFAIGVAAFEQADGRWNEWVSQGRAGGPLWFVVTMASLCGLALGGSGAFSLVRGIRALAKARRTRTGAES